MKKIKVPKTPAKKGKCPIRPNLDLSQGNPMLWCSFDKGHKGKHSWEIK